MANHRQTAEYKRKVQWVKDNEHRARTKHDLSLLALTEMGWSLSSTKRAIITAGVTCGGNVVDDASTYTTAQQQPQSTTRKQQQHTRGIALDNCVVLDRRPAETAKDMIRRLDKGRGYPVDGLAAEWAVSIDTLRRHAKELRCLKYVQQHDGEYVACVLHPETAAKYNGGH